MMHPNIYHEFFEYSNPTIRVIHLDHGIPPAGEESCGLVGGEREREFLSSDIFRAEVLHDATEEKFRSEPRQVEFRV